LNPTNSYICLAYLYIFFKEDILKTQEREAGGLKASKEKRVSQKTGPDRCSAVLINDELKNLYKDVIKKCWHALRKLLWAKPPQHLNSSDVLGQRKGIINKWKLSKQNVKI
jgi:hypothetical protein